jgi:hypothetical protein
MESKNRSRDYLRENDVKKIAYAYITLNLRDNVNEPRSREAKSLKIYINE